MAGRANLPGGSLKYLFIYWKAHLFKCSYRTSTKYTTLHYTTIITLRYTKLHQITLHYTNYTTTTTTATTTTATTSTSTSTSTHFHYHFHYHYYHYYHYYYCYYYYYYYDHHHHSYNYNYSYTSLHFTTATLHYSTLQLQMQLQLQLHYITQHYTTLITLHYTTTATITTLHYTTLQLQAHYFTLQYTRLHYAIPRYSTQHYNTLRQVHHNYYNCNCNYTTLVTLHYNYNYTYNYNYNCATPHYIQQLWWADHCNHCSHSRKHNSNHLSVHQWIRSAIRDSQHPTSPIGFLFLKLPPTPCAALLVTHNSLNWQVDSEVKQRFSRLANQAGTDLVKTMGCEVPVLGGVTGSASASGGLHRRLHHGHGWEGRES